MNPNTLKDLRLKANLSQKDIANQLNISPQAYNRWEKGKAKPTKKNIIRLANILDVPIETLSENKYDYLNFAKVLKNSRLKANLTQEDMANALNINQPRYSNWENGKTTPDQDNIEQLAKILNVSVDYLIEESLKQTQMINTGNNNNLSTNDFSHFNNNTGRIDINTYSNRSQSEEDDDKQIISLLEDILEQQKLLIDILKNK